MIELPLAGSAATLELQDEVRELARRLSFAPLRGRRKIAIVAPAEALNESAFVARGA
ncbi:MAG: hypothetical protein NVS4B10_11410 [Myxococcales bacterium]